MPGTEYECGECGRAFLVHEGEKKEPKCPGCESENVAPRKARPLPSWLMSKVSEGSG